MKKRILVSVEAGETRVAVLESRKAQGGGGRRGRGASADDWRVGELYVERRTSRSIVGNIYKGIVDNVLPGMEAAFIDIGLERNGFLHVDEIVLPDGTAVPRRGRGAGRRIDELLKPGQKVLVQASKDPLKTKGPRLSMRLSVAGRYLVYMPAGEGVGVSKRLPDNERTRLRKELGKSFDGEGGMIVRTAAAGAAAEDFEREIRYVKALYAAAEKRAEDAPAPSIVFQEHDLPIRVLRDVPSKELDGALIDDTKQFERIQTFFTRTAPELVDRVRLNSESERLFDRFGATEALESTLSRRVDLPSGGYLMIDYAEALTVIDINTGRFTGKGKGMSLEETITKVNIEAAEEVVRQLRLRDIGGIIVIDFIDMAKAKNRDQVIKTLRGALGEDPSKSFVVEASPLGLVEMTRENVTDGVREILTSACPTCEGEGVVLSAETMAISVLRSLRDLVNSEPDPAAHLVRVHPAVATELLAKSSALHDLERETGKHFLFEGGVALAIDTFEVVESGARDVLEARAVPVSVGDEVLVSIEEPHMYDADSAIARIDAYVISVAGAAAHVGERKLVRIESVGRSSAAAVLAENEAEKLESAPSTHRDRGGTRGRSVAGAS